MYLTKEQSGKTRGPEGPVKNPPRTGDFWSWVYISAVKEIRAGPVLLTSGAFLPAGVPYAQYVAGLLLHLRRISLFDPGGAGFRIGEPGDLYQISTIRGPLLRLVVNSKVSASQLTESVLANRFWRGWEFSYLNI